MVDIKSQYSLQRANTLACPSVAQYFCSVRSESDINEALGFATQNKCQVRVLGGGSNILPGQNVSGLIIKPEVLGKKTLIESSDECIVKFGAGEQWHECVLWANEQGLNGLENLALIPGTMGAAPIQNIGAYGVELQDVFESLNAVNIKTGLRRSFSKKECQFEYRNSVFKGAEKNRFIICDVTLKLHKSVRNKLHYPSLADTFAHIKNGSVTPKNILEAVVQLRQAKLPDPKNIPNVGSFFKNPIVDVNTANEIKKRYPDAVLFNQENGKKKLAAGWMIEHLGWKGAKINGIVVYPKQALVLTNPQQLTVNFVIDAARAIQEDVKKHFGVGLDIEPLPFGI